MNKLNKTDNHIETYIINEFSKLDFIGRIYAEKYNNKRIYTVFTINEFYDDILMSNMLNVEFDTLKKFKTCKIIFHYLPMDKDSKNIFLPRESRLIFDKNKDKLKWID